MSEPTVHLDETTIWGEDRRMPRAEGFAGQRLQVLPRPLVAQALRRPATARLVVTDCGYFPGPRSTAVNDHVARPRRSSSW